MKKHRRWIESYHVVCKRLHKETERRKEVKEWLRKTPLHDRGWDLPIAVFTQAKPKYDDKAPNDFRFLQNTKECSVFFNKIRKAGISGIKHYKIDLSDVEHIDFASTMMLSAIGEELLNKGCTLSGNSPKRSECGRYLREAGFFNKLFDKNGRRFPNANSSEFITVERGQFKLTKEHYEAFRNLIKHIRLHLTGNQQGKRIYSTIIKEICANSIEWSEAEKSQWTIGAKFEGNKVIIVILDLGKGILEKLYVDYWIHIKDFLTIKNDAEVLYGAFEQKYGSSAQEANRNQGLPCIKSAYDEGHIKDLKVVTNNSIIDFASGEQTRFSHHRATFKGTLYSWCMDAECLK